MAKQSRMSRQTGVGYYQPQRVVVAMAPDESPDAMNAALLRVGVPISTVTYLPIQTLDDFGKEEVSIRVGEIKAQHGEIAVLVEPNEHNSPGKDGRWPVGTVMDEMYAWKAKSIRTMLKTRQKRESVTRGTVESEDHTQGSGPVRNAAVLAAQPGGERVFEAWQNDADYFDQHPSRTYQLRSARPGEFGSAEQVPDETKTLALRLPNGQQVRMIAPPDATEQRMEELVSLVLMAWNRGGMDAVRSIFER
jgi:hypothetical protein